MYSCSFSIPSLNIVKKKYNLITMILLILLQIPHYSIFGDTVEIAGIMESSGEAMKVIKNIIIGF